MPLVATEQPLPCKGSESGEERGWKDELQRHIAISGPTEKISWNLQPHVPATNQAVQEVCLTQDMYLNKGYSLIIYGARSLQSSPYAQL